MNQLFKPDDVKNTKSRAIATQLVHSDQNRTALKVAMALNCLCVTNFSLPVEFQMIGIGLS